MKSAFSCHEVTRMIWLMVKSINLGGNKMNELNLYLQGFDKNVFKACLYYAIFQNYILQIHLNYFKQKKYLYFNF